MEIQFPQASRNGTDPRTAIFDCAGRLESVTMLRRGQDEVAELRAELVRELNAHCATIDRAEKAERQRDTLQRQLDAVDVALGFPHPDGLGRVELVAVLRGALEDILTADETSTLQGAVAIAARALERVK
jgi:hypothetical protein